VRSVAVAMGTPKHIDRYCGRLAPHTACLVRDDTEAYALYGLAQSTAGQMLSFDTLQAGMRAVSRGYLGGLPSGDVMMLSGLFIVDSSGMIRYAYYSKYAGDHPPFAEILESASSL